MHFVESEPEVKMSLSCAPALGERNNEFTELSLDPRNILLQDLVLQETILGM